jgi:hypothetical protein
MSYTLGVRCNCWFGGTLVEPCMGTNASTQEEIVPNYFIFQMENTGFEPRSSESPLNASSTHTPAQTTHIRALRPSRELHDPSPNAQSIHEQHTAVRGERAHSVHSDPALAVVVAAWPTLSEERRAAILQLLEEGEVRR